MQSLFNLRRDNNKCFVNLLYTSWLCWVLSHVNSQQLCKQQFYTNFTKLQGITVDYNQNNVFTQSDFITLQLTQNTGGTRLSVNELFHYGTVTSRLKISHGSNVVSSFILMAENGDEIDFEFVGKDVSVIQTNYFYKNNVVYDHNAKFFKTSKDLSTTFNTYELKWTPDYYQWSFNNHLIRTLHKNMTKFFPDSPSKIQFGIWEANKSSWGGNGINWNLVPFNVTIDWINITCSSWNSTINSNSTATATINSNTNSSSNSDPNSNKTRNVPSENNTNKVIASPIFIVYHLIVYKIVYCFIY